MKPLRRTLRVARHEAAHAVIGELLGCRVERVVLCAKLEQHPKLGELSAYTRWHRRQRVTPLTAAIISCAGNAYEWHKGTLDAGSGEVTRGDAMMACEEASLCLFDVGRLTQLTQLLVAKRGIASRIERVAKALVKRDLSGAEVRRIAKLPRSR